MATDDEDPDDWFSEPKPRRQRPVRTWTARSQKPKPTDVGPAEDWIQNVNQNYDGRVRESRGLRSFALAASALVLLLIALAAGGVFSSNGEPPEARSSTTTTTATAPTLTRPVQPRRPTLTPPTTTLKPGDTGVQVKALQRALARLAYPVGPIDGNYGPSTQQAVATFQQSKGLTRDGILGPHTLHALKVAIQR